MEHTTSEFFVLTKAFQPCKEAVLLLDPSTDFTILYANPAVEKILLYTPQELIGKSIDIILPISSHVEDFLDVLEDNFYLKTLSWQITNKQKVKIDIEFTIQIFPIEIPSFKELVILYIYDESELKNLERSSRFTKNLLRAVREIKQILSLNITIQEAIQQACRSLQKSRSFDLVWAVLCGEEKPEFFIQSKNPLAEDMYLIKFEKFFHENPNLLPIYKVLQDPYHLMNFYSSYKDSNYTEFLKIFENCSHVEGLSFQISWNERIYGAIDLMYFGDYIFSADDVQILQELGTDIGFFIFNKNIEKTKSEAIKKIEYQGILLETIDVPILTLDRVGRIQYCNLAAEKRLGYTYLEMKSLNANQILGLPSITMDYLRTRAIQKEVVIQNSRVEEFPALIHTSPIIGKNKELLGVMIVLFDITERKEQEIENRNLDRLLIESAKFASIGELAAGIAHEINNPLQSALLYLEDLIEVDEENPQERKKILQIIEAAILRIKKLIEGLLDLGRSPSSEKDWIHPELVTERVLDLLEGSARKKKIKLEKNIDQNLPSFHVRWQEIEQVIINCIINSINAISEMPNPPQQPKISIKVTKINYKNQDYIQFRIEDNGPGILLENMDKVFLPLFTTRREKHGTGLGLAISKKIVESHGGRIYIDQFYQNGCCIVFEIPVK